MELDLQKIQVALCEKGVDGWLLYDHHGSNAFARELLSIPKEVVVTRRFFYWIPKEGVPVKIVHSIESEALDHLPGAKRVYLSWEELEKELAAVLKGAKVMAAEYSPRNANPNVSVLDAGTMDLLREMGKEVISSEDLLQLFTSVLDERQLVSHKAATAVLLKTLDKAWEMIVSKVRGTEAISEYDVQQFILSEFTANNCITDDGPTCSVNENTAHPHYLARRKSSRPIAKGDFVMIDLWCKQNVTHGVYADITRVAVLAPEPTPKQQDIFDVVASAQKAGIAFLEEQLESKLSVQGKEIDDVVRKVIVDAGFGPQFTHRTGHNIDTSVHGSGAHLDNLETSDSRKILPGTCFSIEPGIYLPGEFGVRLENDVLVHLDGRVEVTSPFEESILCLL